MNLAFVLYKYFPYGGLQRDMMRIAHVCQERGHHVTIFTLGWEGERPEAISVQVLPVRRLSNHNRNLAFHAALSTLFAEQRIDGVIGFNKMPGLDVYYAADACLKERLQRRSRVHRWLPRNRHFLRYEQAVFAPTSSTRILMISAQQLAHFERHYGTPRDRIELLPPGIDRSRMAPPDAAGIRAEFRRAFDFSDEDKLVLMVGSGFRIKGLDRALRAMAALPESVRRRSRLFVIGQDNPRAFLRLAKRLGITESVRVFPGRDDVPRFLLGADLLIHPAYFENTGTVLLEAAVAGLPVLTTDTCGYAAHVLRARAGHAVESPYDQRVLDRELAEMLASPQWLEWSNNGIAYGRREDLYSMPERAADVILATVSGRSG